MSKKNVVAFHPVLANTFESKPKKLNFSARVAVCSSRAEAGQAVAIQIHPLGAMSVCSKSI